MDTHMSSSYRRTSICWFRLSFVCVFYLTRLGSVCLSFCVLFGCCLVVNDWLKDSSPKDVSVSYLVQGCTTALRPRAENSRPAGPRAGVGFWGNGITWCILSSKIASGGNFIDYFFFSWKSGNGALWWILKYAYTSGVPNNWKSPKVPDFGMNWNRTLEAAINFKKMRLKHQLGHFKKVLW